jgi:hypothetical protein
MNPKTGSAAGGYPVLLYGTRFIGKEIVLFGKQPVVPLSVVTSGQSPHILCLSPPGKAGDVVEVCIRISYTKGIAYNEDITSDGTKKLGPHKFQYTEGIRLVRLNLKHLDGSHTNLSHDSMVLGSVDWKPKIERLEKILHTFLRQLEDTVSAQSTAITREVKDLVSVIKGNTMGM